MDLITIEDDMPTYNPHLRQLEPFRSILARDKGSKGDADGRKKLHATKELAYIYFLADYASPIWNVEEDRRDVELRRLAQLPEKWKPDSLIDEAIDVYKKLQRTPTIRALEEMRESMHSTADVIAVLRKTLNDIIGSKSDAETKSAELGVAVKLLTDINKLANDFPSLTRSLEEVELKVKREVESKTGRKKTAVGVLEDRNSANVF